VKAAREGHAADGEIMMLGIMDESQERIGPPIFRRLWIFGDTVEQRAFNSPVALYLSDAAL
jgi:hypothetical protein